MVAMNKTYVEYTQKGMGRKSKHVTTKKKKKSAKYKRKAVIEGPKKKKRLQYIQKTNSKTA